MFFTKRAFKVFSSSARCSDDNSFFLFLAGWPMVLLLLASRILPRRRRPVRRFYTKLLGVLQVQPLPAAELHRVGADQAADGLPREEPIEHIETNVPSRSAHGDVALTDVGPQRQARAAGKRFEFPPHIEAAPLVLQRLRSIGSRHHCFGNARRGRSYRGELHRGSNRAQTPIGVEGRPLAQMLRLRERLPDFLRRVTQLLDKNERPLLAVFLYLRRGGRTRFVLFALHHLLLLAGFLLTSAWIMNVTHAW